MSNKVFKPEEGATQTHWGVIYDEFGTVDYFGTRALADFARDTENGKLPLLEVVATVVDAGTYEEPKE